MRAFERNAKFFFCFVRRRDETQTNASFCRAKCVKKSQICALRVSACAVTICCVPLQNQPRWRARSQTNPTKLNLNCRYLENNQKSVVNSLPFSFFFFFASLDTRQDFCYNFPVSGVSKEKLNATNCLFIDLIVGGFKRKI